MATGAAGPILVVEDDQDIRETIATVLGEEGYAVVVAANGAEAIEILRRDGAQRPRFILLDLMMPVMNGWELNELLRKDVDLSMIPVVVLSGDATVTDRADDLGAAAVLRKPVSLAKLLEVVRRFD